MLNTMIISSPLTALMANYIVHHAHDDIMWYMPKGSHDTYKLDYGSLKRHYFKFGIIDINIWFNTRKIVEESFATTNCLLNIMLDVRIFTSLKDVITEINKLLPINYPVILNEFITPLNFKVKSLTFTYNFTGKYIQQYYYLLRGGYDLKQMNLQKTVSEGIKDDYMSYMTQYTGIHDTQNEKILQRYNESVHINIEYRKKRFKQKNLPLFCTALFEIARRDFKEELSQDLILLCKNVLEKSPRLGLLNDVTATIPDVAHAALLAAYIDTKTIAFGLDADADKIPFFIDEELLGIDKSFYYIDPKAYNIKEALKYIDKETFYTDINAFFAEHREHYETSILECLEKAYDEAEKEIPNDPTPNVRETFNGIQYSTERIVGYPDKEPVPTNPQNPNHKNQKPYKEALHQIDRLQIQINLKRNKIERICQQMNFSDRIPEYFLNKKDEIDKTVFHDYMSQISGKGTYYKYKDAEKIIDEAETFPNGKTITHKRKNRMKDVLKGVASYKSISTYLSHVEDEEITYPCMASVRKRTIALTLLREIQSLGICPLNISVRSEYKELENITTIFDKATESAQ